MITFLASSLTTLLTVSANALPDQATMNQPAVNQPTKVVCDVNEGIRQGEKVVKRNTYVLEAPTPDQPRQAEIEADSRMFPGFHVEVIACRACASVNPSGTWIRKPEVVITISNSSFKASSDASSMDVYTDGSLTVGDNFFNIGCYLVPQTTPQSTPQTSP